MLSVQQGVNVTGITLGDTRQYTVRWRNAAFRLVDLAPPASFGRFLRPARDSRLGVLLFRGLLPGSLLLQFEQIPIARVLESHIHHPKRAFGHPAHEENVVQSSNGSKRTAPPEESATGHTVHSGEAEAAPSTFYCPY